MHRFSCLKNIKLVSNISKPIIRGVKDFFGTRHAQFYSGTLIGTKQKVFVMDQAKVNLISTEQIFKNKQASFALINEHNLLLFNDQVRPIPRATNPGDGSYICTSKDLVKACSDTWTRSPVLLHPSRIKSLYIITGRVKLTIDARDHPKTYRSNILPY